MKSLLAIGILLLASCSAAGGDDDDDFSSPDGSVNPPPTPDAAGGPDGAAATVDAAGGDPGDPDDLPDPGTYRYLCDLEPPEGAPEPTLPIYSGGAGNCPTLFHFDGVDKQARNEIASSGVTRRFILVAPYDFVPGTEELPVAVLWHHMGSDPDTFLKDDYLQNGANSERFLAILPESKGDLEFAIPGVEPEWPWMSSVTEERIEEELQFFDDMIACVAEQYGLAKHCVSNGGVSAGGMWNAIVAARRSELLASTISVSGGIDGPSWIGAMGRGWDGATRKLPALVVWGGDADSCVTVDFQASSMALEAELDADGHSIIECIHNCGHGVPPFELEGALSAAPLWEYFMNHPYWLSAGNSPYKWSGIPATTWPTWCGVGAGSATPRTGACASPACPL